MDFRTLIRRIGMLIALPQSIYFNFHYLPFKQAIKLPIIFCTLSQFWSLKGKVIIDSQYIRFGMIRLGLFNAAINNEKGFVWANEGGTVIFHGSFSAGTGSVLKISQPHAVLEIGADVHNASALKIDCNYRITIHERTSFGWGVVVLDSSFHRLKKADGSWVSRGFDAVELWNDSWISSYCVVLPGSEFPPYSVLAMGSIINQKYAKEEQGLYAGKPAVFKRAGVHRDMSDNCISYEE